MVLCMTTHFLSWRQAAADRRPAGLAEDQAAVGRVELNAAHTGRFADPVDDGHAGNRAGNRGGNAAGATAGTAIHVICY